MKPRTPADENEKSNKELHCCNDKKTLTHAYKPQILTTWSRAYFPLSKYITACFDSPAPSPEPDSYASQTDTDASNTY